MKYLVVSSGCITIALIPSESRETMLEMTRMDGVRVQRAGELKQRRQWRQRERQKSKRFRQGKQQLCTCITLFCTFLSRRCTTTTWKCLISRFVEDGNTGQQLSFSFLELWYSPSELNSQKIANIWRIKRDGKSAIKFEAARIHFLSDVFVALPSLLLELSSDGKINRFAVSAVKST